MEIFKCTLSKVEVLHNLYRLEKMVIGRGRRREHPKDTSEGVTTDIVQLPVAHAQNILPDRARDVR